VTGSLFDALEEPDRSALLKLARRRRFTRGEVVFHEGDPGESLHAVVKGIFVARGSSTRGHVLDVNVFRAGSVFGELALLGGSPLRNATLIALEPGETLSVGRKDFDELRRRSARVDDFLVSVLAERNRALTTLVVELMFTPADQRVLRRLLLYAELTGASTDGGSITISQEELAAMAGTTRATVNRALRRVERDGLIELSRGHVRLLDVGSLRGRSG
jgi:CRP/FNR family transcriptional regulator, cyclic AMP receptor protein